MNKPIAIIAGEPNSISSEIIFKFWRMKSKFKHKPILVIGSVNLLNLQKKKLKYKIKIKNIDHNFDINELKGNQLPVYNVEYKQKKPFEKITSKSNKYILECFNKGLKLAKENRIIGFVNCPVKKETLFKKNYQGVTEFLSRKSKKEGGELMLIFNKKLAVSPVTTHIPLSQVSRKINKGKIIKNVKIIYDFYKKKLQKKVTFGILGLNPHNFSQLKRFEEKQIINRAITSLSKSKIKVYGPIPPDTSFMLYKKHKFDVIIGMYHDQVLTPFKALFNYNF